MKLLFAGLLAGLACFLAAQAPTPREVTMLNNGTNSARYMRFDTKGHGLEAHEPVIRKFGSTYYLYGSAYNCGATWQEPTNSRWCGTSVYTSPDLTHWTFVRMALNDTAGYEPLCDYPLCQNPQLFYDSTAAAGKEYQLWGLDIQAASTPDGPFTFYSSLPCEAGAPWKDPDNGQIYIVTNNYSGGAAHFNMKVQKLEFQTGNCAGNVCAAFDDCSASSDAEKSKYRRTGTALKFGSFFRANSALPAIDAMDSNEPRNSGTYTEGPIGEGHPIIKRTTSGTARFYLLYAYPGCTFCDGQGSSLRYIMTNGITDMTDSTTSTTGWLNGSVIGGGITSGASERMLRSDGCAGQSANVERFNGDPGTGIIWIDRWQQITSFDYPGDASTMWKRQGAANYHFEPLTFASNGTIDTLTCASKIKHSLATSVGAQEAITNLDQTSGTREFLPACDIGMTFVTNPRERVQTFRAGRSGTLTELSFTTWQNSGLTTDGNPLPNANLKVALISVNGDGTPGGTEHASNTFTRRAFSDGQTTPVSGTDKIGWAPRKFSWNPSFAVTAGTYYGIRVSSTANSTNGCYGFAFNDTGIAYSAGKEFYSDNGGSSWTLESGRALKFETVVVTP